MNGCETDGLVELDGEQYYEVHGVDRMAPFLMSVVSDGDRWMFVSSSGALTAGRRDAGTALFPYVTDDRLHASGGAVGPVTRVRVEGSSAVWRPFAPGPVEGVRRSIAKAVVGDSVVFEEQQVDLGLTVTSRWASAEEFGFVRTVTVRNDRSATVRVEVLDGLLDVLPAGLEPALYGRLSNLTNAYKRSELVDPEVALAVYSLEAPVSDQAEPVEVLRATTVWSTGLDGRVTLDAGAVAAFERGAVPEPRPIVTGVPGAYLVHGTIELAAGASATWHLVADVGRDHADVTALRRRLRRGVAATDVLAATGRTRDHLVRIMAPADAAQCTGDPVACAHHVSNVTYNVMRGGVPRNGYHLETADVVEFVRVRNRRVAARHEAWFSSLPATIERRALVDAVAELGDVHLARLVDEYLPFSFSRRHGDPSRPWNQFSIRVADDEGRPVVYFEGNWRDLFQNWEATCGSFPEYLPGVVSTFVDASTADGYNPYRVTRDGIDWEEPDPDDPWANLGYWGDHQIVYLLRLLEATDRYLPGEIVRRLDRRSCTYADVPYRVAPHESLVRDPKATIEYDESAAARSAHRVEELGGDGKLLVDADGEIVLVTLLEKLLVTSLAKLSNFVPGGGIWMNTQRPEWNDANNALVGYGLSMVTLFHLRRFLDHLRGLVTQRAADGAGAVPVSAEVAQWLGQLTAAFAEAPVGGGSDPDRARRALVDRLGAAGSAYRSRVYERGFSGVTEPVDAEMVAALCDAAIAHLDDTVAASRRPDGLVHAYRLVRFPADDLATIEDLPEMLEGQVAALTPGLLSATEQADLLDALFASELYRPDQDSFVLAPPRRPPAFLDKNVIPASHVERNALFAALVEAGDRTIVQVDADDAHRFAPGLTTEAELVAALDRLGSTGRWTAQVAECRALTLDTYEAVFGHRSYVGRSGSMYAYEGIGSIYWHMVTKLLLATQEAAAAASATGADPRAVARLVDAYRRVRDGLGYKKSAAEFGAIPIDPYSHTPAHAGAQQPGMTGAVKEEILARPRELGVRVEAGEIVVDALLADRTELLERPTSWSVTTVEGVDETLELPAGALGFTLCGVPVVVTVAEATPSAPSVDLDLVDGRTVRIDGDRVGREWSAAVFGRTGTVRRIRATVVAPADPSTVS
jgi:hypothetical protein